MFCGGCAHGGFASDIIRVNIGYTGKWTHQNNRGLIEVIRDDVVVGPDGTESKLVAEGPEGFSIELQGTTYRARLVDGQLVWDDEDVWVRATAEDMKHADKALREFEVERERRERERREAAQRAAEAEAEAAARAEAERLQRLQEEAERAAAVAKAEAEHRERERLAAEAAAAAARAEAERLEREREETERLRKERKAAITQFLRDHGFSGVDIPKRQGGCGLTPMTKTTYAIHYAAELCDARLVEMLLAEGADPAQKNSSGHTAAQAAQRKEKKGSHAEVLRVLGGGGGRAGAGRTLGGA